eukprot:2490260-Pyramimonas_sp.AAC.1
MFGLLLILLHLCLFSRIAIPSPSSEEQFASRAKTGPLLDALRYHLACEVSRVWEQRCAERVKMLVAGQCDAERCLNLQIAFRAS